MAPPPPHTHAIAGSETINAKTTVYIVLQVFSKKWKGQESKYWKRRKERVKKRKGKERKK
jgi:hypothetical protein